MNIYTIYDHKAAAYMEPFFLPTDGMATRAFTDAVSDENHNFGRHPEDYAIFRLGTWDKDTGEINLLSVPTPLLTGQQAFAALLAHPKTGPAADAPETKQLQNQNPT